MELEGTTSGGYGGRGYRRAGGRVYSPEPEWKPHNSQSFQERTQKSLVSVAGNHQPQTKCHSASTQNIIQARPEKDHFLLTQLHSIKKGKKIGIREEDFLILIRIRFIPLVTEFDLSHQSPASLEHYNFPGTQSSFSTTQSSILDLACRRITLNIRSSLHCPVFWALRQYSGSVDFWWGPWQGFLSRLVVLMLPSAEHFLRSTEHFL